MDAKLQVEISADNRNLTKGMAEASRIVATESAKIDKASNSVVNSLNKVGDANKKAKFSTIELSRVIQDLPFGFIGIQNNLTQLIPGIGALGIGFSALVSAITFSQVGLRNWIKESKEAKEAAKTLNEQLESYISTLNQLDQARIKGEQNAQKEILSLKTLYDASQNANLSLAERKRAVDELQKQYPTYFKNLSDESILAGNATGAYNNLTKALIAKAKAQAYSDQIAENSKNILALNTKILSDEEVVTARLTKIRNEWNKAVYQGKGNAEIDRGRAEALEEVLSRERSLIETELGLTDARKNRFSLTLSNVKLEDEVNKLIEDQGVNVLDLNTGLEKNAEDYKRSKVEALDYKKAIDEQNKAWKESLSIISNYISERSKTNMPTTLQALNIPFSFTNDQIIPDEVIKKMIAAEKWEEQIDELGKRIGYTFRSSIQDAVGDITEGLSNTLLSGGSVINSLSSVMLESVGNMAVQLGKLAIGTGIAIKGIKEALKSLNPAAAIGAGVALVALGTFVKGAAASIAEKGGSGGSYSLPSNTSALPTSSAIQTRNPAIGATGGNQIVVLETVVKGSDLVFVQRKSESRERRYT